jgi:hypothetical protein
MTTILIAYPGQGSRKRRLRRRLNAAAACVLLLCSATTHARRARPVVNSDVSHRQESVRIPAADKIPLKLKGGATEADRQRAAQIYEFVRARLLAARIDWRTSVLILSPVTENGVLDFASEERFARFGNGSYPQNIVRMWLSRDIYPILYIAVLDIRDRKMWAFPFLFARGWE